MMGFVTLKINLCEYGTRIMDERSAAKLLTSGSDLLSLEYASY